MQFLSDMVQIVWYSLGYYSLLIAATAIIVLVLVKRGIRSIQAAAAARRLLEAKAEAQRRAEAEAQRKAAEREERLKRSLEAELQSFRSSAPVTVSRSEIRSR